MMIWQITEISINYFKFETVSRINIAMPGREEAKALNVCFRYDEFHRNETVFEIFNKIQLGFSDRDKIFYRKQAIREYFNISEKLDVSYNFSEIFDTHSNRSVNVTKFIYFHYVCYHVFRTPMGNDSMVYEIEWDWDADPSEIVKNSSDEMPYFHIDMRKDARENLTNVTMLYAMLSPRNIFPWLEFYTLPLQKTKFNQSQYFYTLSGFSYSNQHLTSPYVDDCIDYEKLGFFDRNDAINSCSNEIFMAFFGTPYNKKIFTRGEPKRYRKKPKIVETWHRAICANKYPNVDCNRKNVFTHISSLNQTSEVNEIDFIVKPSDKPSFDIQSQAKIEDMDYTCYVLGTVGIWFGLSFINLNPSILIDLIAKHVTPTQVNPVVEVDTPPTLPCLEAKLTAHAQILAADREELSAQRYQFQMVKMKLNAIKFLICRQDEILKGLKC